MARSTREMTGSGSEVIRMHRLNWPGSADPEVMALRLSLQRPHEKSRDCGAVVWAEHGLTPAEIRCASDAASLGAAARVDALRNSDAPGHHFRWLDQGDAEPRIERIGCRAPT